MGDYPPRRETRDTMRANLLNEVENYVHWEDGAEDLDVARRAMAEELRQAARRLDRETAEERPDTSRSLPTHSSKEAVVYGLIDDMSHQDLADILGGGEHIRSIREKAEVAFVVFQSIQAATRLTTWGNTVSWKRASHAHRFATHGST